MNFCDIENENQMIEKHISCFFKENDFKSHLKKVYKTLQNSESKQKIWVHMEIGVRLSEIVELVIDANLFEEIKVYVKNLIVD